MSPSNPAEFRVGACHSSENYQVSRFNHKNVYFCRLEPILDGRIHIIVESWVTSSKCESKPIHLISFVG